MREKRISSCQTHVNLIFRISTHFTENVAWGFGRI